MVYVFSNTVFAFMH